MDVEKIRELRRANPFKPFYLIMEDGRKLPVEHPLYLVVSPTDTFLTYAAPQGGVDFLTVKNVKDVEVDELMETPWMKKLRSRLQHG